MLRNIYLIMRTDIFQQRNFVICWHWHFLIILWRFYGDYIVWLCLRLKCWLLLSFSYRLFSPSINTSLWNQTTPFFPPIPFPTTFVILFSRNLRALRLIQRLYINRYKLPDWFQPGPSEEISFPLLPSQFPSTIYVQPQELGYYYHNHIHTENTHAHWSLISVANFLNNLNQPKNQQHTRVMWSRCRATATAIRFGVLVWASAGVPWMLVFFVENVLFGGQVKCMPKHISFL